MERHDMNHAMHLEFLCEAITNLQEAADALRIAKRLSASDEEMTLAQAVTGNLREARRIFFESLSTAQGSTGAGA